MSSSAGFLGLRAGRIARSPFLPVRIGCLYVDEFVPEPNTPQSKVRIEPAVSLNEPLESVLCILQKIMRVAQARDPWLRAQPDNAATVIRHTNQSFVPHNSQQKCCTVICHTRPAAPEEVRGAASGQYPLSGLAHDQGAADHAERSCVGGDGPGLYELSPNLGDGKG